MTGPLHELQRRFQATMREGNPVHISGAVAVDRVVTPELGIGIYMAGYRVRLNEVLALDFPKLHCVLGEEPFERLTSAFVRDFPSSYCSIADIGRPLARWLAQQPLYQSRPYLAEFARLEWAMCVV